MHDGIACVINKLACTQCTETSTTSKCVRSLASHPKVSTQDDPTQGHHKHSKLLWSAPHHGKQVIYLGRSNKAYLPIAVTAPSYFDSPHFLGCSSPGALRTAPSTLAAPTISLDSDLRAALSVHSEDQNELVQGVWVSDALVLGIPMKNIRVNQRSNRLTNTSGSS